MVLQAGYFDDSGSNIDSRYYVLAGFLATVDQWKVVAGKWAGALDREGLRYFKMSEAMALKGQFSRGWNASLRDRLILELVDIVSEVNPWRIECFLDRRLFDTFVKGILDSAVFSGPYFVRFYQIVLSVAHNAERIGWSRDCDFIFDEQGKIGDIARSKWEWMKQNIDGIQEAANVAPYLGSPPIFRNDIAFRPLQAADMFAWLVRDCMSFGPERMEEISRAALKHLETTENDEQRILRLHIDREMLMKLGASFLVGKARLYGYV